MKKEKKVKKSEIKEVKESKKELKKKLNPEPKKSNVSKKTKEDSTMPIKEEIIDLGHLKKSMVNCAELYQNILISPKNFDNGCLLYPSEIKALEMIGDFPLINLTQLANKLSISKSAVSKCSSKLLEKKLITKEKSETNIREVVFLLTNSGEKIYHQLPEKHRELVGPIEACLHQFSSQELALFENLFSLISGKLESIQEKIHFKE